MSLLGIMSLFPYLVAFVALFFSVGGFLAYRQGFSQQSGEIQARTIEALKTRVETLEGQVDEYKEEIKRQRQVLDTIRYALKKRGLTIDVNGVYINVYDEQTRATATIPIGTAEDDAQVKKEPHSA